jgi:hypothetical protein
MLFSAVKDTLLDYADRGAFVPELFVAATFGSNLNWNSHIHVIITAAVFPSTMMNG